jgi:hypothetical protein
VNELTGESYESIFCSVETLGPRVNDTSEPMPSPGGARHLADEELVQALEVHLVEPTETSSTGFEPPKFDPSMLSHTEPQSATLFICTMLSTGASKVKRCDAVPTPVLSVIGVYVVTDHTKRLHTAEVPVVQLTV